MNDRVAKKLLSSKLMKKAWVTILALVVTATICWCILNIGITIGRDLGRNEYHNFYTRNLGHMVAELDQHRKKGEIELLLVKVQLINDNWDSVGIPNHFGLLMEKFDLIDDAPVEGQPNQVDELESAPTVTPNTP